MLRVLCVPPTMCFLLHYEVSRRTKNRRLEFLPEEIILILIELSYVENPARCHKEEKHHPEGENVRRTLIQRQTVTVQKYSEKATSSL